MTDFESKVSRISALLGKIPFSTDTHMSEHTFFRIGGTPRLFISPDTEEELCFAVNTCRANGAEPFILGNGSNLLVNDGVMDIVVISTKKLNSITVTGDCEITAGAGALLKDIALFALDNSLTGCEFIHGIPGSLGGAVYMNCGAYGGETKDIITSSVVLGPDGKIRKLAHDEHGFSYRHSAIAENGYIVLRSVIKLRKGVKADIKAGIEELYIKRSEKQPLEYPSAGSTFKRPKTGYAAALIEESGLKGLTIGGAQVSKKHAGFIVNIGGATYSDVTALIKEIQRRVFEATGVELEPEIRIVGGE